MGKRDEWKRMHEERRESNRQHSEVWKRLHGAVDTHDTELVYCRFCHGPIGWKGMVFSHGCIQEGNAFGWLDLRKREYPLILQHEIPGTLLYAIEMATQEAAL